ncbi:MAG: dihydrolipoamide acetyltransferase family protein [Hyphomicrobiales bacterium]
MATKIIMPQGGQDITEGFVVRWFKKEGEPIRRGEVICEVETEKAVFEVEAPGDGVLLKIVATEGTKVPIFSVIGVIGEPGERIDLDGLLSAPPEERPLDVSAIRRRLAGGDAEKTDRPKVTGRARKLASEKGVDLSRVAGSGPQGRITEKDILIHVEKRKLSVPALRGQTRPPSRMRQAIARRMVQSKQTIPHFYVTVSADVTAALELRNRLHRETGEAISITDIIVRASALALKEVPAVNCRMHEDQMVFLEDINIGIAVTLDDGVLVPILPRADQLSLPETARQVREAVELARRGKLAGVEPACFTVSNLGMWGIESFTAIINPPETGILAVGSVQKRPVVQNGTDVRIRDMLTLTLSVDHRVVDGALAARFISRIRHHLENPEGLAG